MTRIALKFDATELEFDLSGITPAIFMPNEPDSGIIPDNIVKKALQTPILGHRERDYSGKSIAIAINDQTRPLPHANILPHLVDYLLANGAQKEKISFYIATGTHRKLTDEEIAAVLPGNLSIEYAYICHDCDDASNLAFLGLTRRQTPVFVNRPYYQSDLKIVVGNIEPHHFMGFSGGMKTAAIGLTGRETIQKNHSMLPDPYAKMGLYKTNPMRMDVEEIGRMIGVHYALNVILNDQKRIVKAFWGDPAQVMEVGIPFSLQVCQLDVDEADCRYDLVIASAGGFPKDINLYQSQKAITNACLFSKKGGVIILAAGCRDGAGNAKFQEYTRTKNGWQEVLEDFPRRPFEIGPHKAFQLALQARDHTIILVSRMPPEEVKRCMLTPAKDMAEALEIASTYLPREYRTAVLPFATHSIPKMNWGE
jgi:lactate racemase